MELSKNTLSGPTSYWNPTLHVKIDINQCTLPIPKIYLPTTRAVLFKRYFVCAKFNKSYNIQWIDYNGEKPPKEIRLIDYTMTSQQYKMIYPSNLQKEESL